MKTYRRRFLQTSSALIALAPFKSLFAQAAQCGFTGDAIEGPFYVSGMPLGSQINPRAAPGAPMRVSGIVLSADGKTPLAAAKVELWHADTEGKYHPVGSGKASDYKPDELNLRGSVMTDAQGRFMFESIVPGVYARRRRHLHWKVTATSHSALTTQTYWASERGSPSALRDFVDRNSEACRWLDFRNDAQGVAIAAFQVVLARA